MTFRILARSNIKDSMTFLMPNLLCGAQTNSGARGTPPTETYPPEICIASEGIKLTRVHHGFPRAGALGAELTWGFPTRKWRNAGRVAAAISMVSAGVEARS
jgi:hypothetical protein